MEDIKFPPIDLLFPDNITPVIVHLETVQGMNQEQIIKWFKKHDPEHKNECESYFTAINAGEPNPLLIPFKY